MKNTQIPKEHTEALLKVLANHKARLQQAEIACVAARKREDCCLHLAYVLLGLKSQLGLSFEDLSTELGRAVDAATLHRIAYRHQGVRARTYKALTQRINELRGKVDLEAVEFDSWTEYK